MGRWGIGTQKDIPYTQDGDAFFKGIDMLHDPSIVPPGYLCKSENKRLREGPAARRRGTLQPGDFNPVFSNIFIGSGIFNNPNGDQVMLVAELDQTYVWAFQFGKDPVQIDLDVGQVTGTAPGGLVEFVQAFDKVLMLRFPSGAPLVWDGDNTSTFDPVTLVAPGATLIPTKFFGIPYKNRIVLYNPYWAADPDTIIITDINNYSSYDNVYGSIRINAGESDVITSVQPYFEDALIIYKKQSVHMLENFTQPLADGNGSGQQRMLNNRIGGVSVHLPILAGRDAIFASEPGGFYRVSEIIQNQIATQPVPISRLIQPVIDQIDWLRMRWWGCSELLGDYAFFGITRKNIGTTGLIPGCDALLVYNIVTGEWESAPDTRGDPSFLINALHVTLYDGAQRLFALDYQNQTINLLEEGVEDEINGDSIPIHDVMRTRGYTAGDPAGFKRFQRAVIGVRTYDPQASVRAISDGYNEVKELATITKDRTKYYIHGQSDYDPETGDADAPKRQDYSIAGDFELFAVEDFEEFPVGPIDFLPPTGINQGGPMQQSLERFQIRQNGRYCQIEVESDSGQCDVLGVGIEAIPAQEGIKVVA